MKNQCCKLCSSESVECTCRRTDAGTNGNPTFEEVFEQLEKDRAAGTLRESIAPEFRQAPLNGAELQERDQFNRWFTGLLHASESCAQRDVLRETKETLWSAWKKEFIRD